MPVVRDQFPETLNWCEALGAIKVPELSETEPVVRFPLAADKVPPFIERELVVNVLSVPMMKEPFVTVAVSTDMEFAKVTVLDEVSMFTSIENGKF